MGRVRSQEGQCHAEGGPGIIRGRSNGIRGPNSRKIGQGEGFRVHPRSGVGVNQGSVQFANLALAESEVCSNKINRITGQKPVRLGARDHGRSGAVLTQGLEVERHKLAADVPEELWHVVG